MSPSLRHTAPLLLVLGALAAPTHANDPCARPGMVISPSCNPNVDTDDGAIDYIDVHPNTPLTFQYSVAGLDHEKSLLVSTGYATFALYAVSPAEVPFPLTPCADLALPFDATVLPVPSSTMELPVEIELPLSAPSVVDLWHQTLSVDLLTPGFPIATSDLARVRFKKEACAGDPSTSQEYGCYYFGYYVWNLLDGVGPVEGRIYWPSDCTPGTDPAGVHPLVLFVHGDGQSFEDYHYLMRHLAFNGFIAATINGGQQKTNVERAERVRTYLSFIRNSWEYKDHVENRIALMGHGRGGEAVLAATRKMAQDWNLDHDVDAVICLAPTNNDGNGGTEGLETSKGQFFGDSLLVIAGSLDNQVTGYCKGGTAPDCGTVPTTFQETGFHIYDAIGTEYTTEGPAPDTVAITKSMLFVERADHDRWRDQPCVDPPPFMLHKPLDCDVHHDILKGYTNAFARWRLRDQEDYKPYFTGEWSTDPVVAEGVRVQTQYMEGQGRRVIDNFTNGNHFVGTTSSVLWSNEMVYQHEGPVFDYGNYTSPHSTSALVTRWLIPGPMIDAFYRWIMPMGADIWGNVYRDFSGFRTLSLRVGLVDGSTSNPVGQSTRIAVRLKDASGVRSPAVELSDYAELSYPHQSVVTTPLLFIKETAKSSMRTVRIPLSSFEDVDLSDIENVELYFGDVDHPTGEVMIDNIELVP